MSAGEESGFTLRENRTLLPAPLPPDEARGSSPPLRGCLRSGYALPSTPPQRHSHPDCRAVLTLIVAQHRREGEVGHRVRSTHDGMLGAVGEFFHALGDVIV